MHGDKTRQTDVSCESASNDDAILKPHIKDVTYIQNIGRFERAQSIANAKFGLCTLVFGENGWGKSTLADLLRSLTKDNPDILIGRKTLASGPEQKAIIRFGSGRAIFKDGSWTGIRPRIAVYDSVFVNENVFSGDVVTADHLKKQYCMVVGEEGVRRVRRIVELDKNNRDNNNHIRLLRRELEGILTATGPTGMTLEEFLHLKTETDINAQIRAKHNEVERANRERELKNAAEPKLLSIPTETEDIRKCLHSTIESIGQAAATTVRAHIGKHEAQSHPGLMTHESWLEAGLTFVDERECAFCGQPVRDRALLDSYVEFFSGAYKRLAADVKAKRAIFARYGQGQFRSRTNDLLKQNAAVHKYWKEAGRVEPPILDGANKAIADMEKAACLLDSVFAEKQANLTESAASSTVEAAIAAWHEARNKILGLNRVLQANWDEIRELKSSVSASELPRLEKDLKRIYAVRRRHEDDTVALIKELRDRQATKGRIATDKARERQALTEHGRVITNSLGGMINSYLTRLNAGFRIVYKAPNYRGKEPAASYQILINDVPVPPRITSENPVIPSFRNTLSAGDKSTLALALFLARITTDPELEKTIVVLDDPFTSLDNFRRQFTAIEIRKLCRQAGQTIVLCHDKNFLRLLWDKIGHRTTTCLAIQTGAPGMTTITPYDIKSETQSRHITERMKIEEYVAGEAHEAGYIRALLRTVCEDFYRRGDAGLFNDNATLDEIIRILEAALPNHPYKASIEDLRGINAYSRGEHHAEIEDDPSGESSEEELKGFCRRVLQLTCGM